jgi:hypothetical protein
MTINIKKLRHIIKIKKNLEKQPLSELSIWNQVYLHFTTITEIWDEQCRNHNILPINNPDRNFYKSCSLIVHDKITKKINPKF